MSELQFTVPAEQSGKRIDSWLAEQIEGLTRSKPRLILLNKSASGVKGSRSQAGEYSAGYCL